jgi:hypothetical protein
MVMLSPKAVADGGVRPTHSPMPGLDPGIFFMATEEDPRIKSGGDETKLLLSAP